VATQLAHAKKSAERDIKAIHARVLLLKREDDRLQFKIRQAKVQADKMNNAKEIARQ
jgi:hypothetical protein